VLATLLSAISRAQGLEAPPHTSRTCPRGPRNLDRLRPIWLLAPFLAARNGPPKPEALAELRGVVALLVVERVITTPPLRANRFDRELAARLGLTPACFWRPATAGRFPPISGATRIQAAAPIPTHDRNVEALRRLLRRAAAASPPAPDGPRQPICRRRLAAVLFNRG